MLLVLNQSPLSTIFATVQFPGGAKFVLSGDPPHNGNIVVATSHLKFP